jgi:hypothetical protein
MKAKQLLLTALCIGAIGASILIIAKDKNVIRQITHPAAQLSIEGELPALGSRVRVPFGRGERIGELVEHAAASSLAPAKLKPIREVRLKGLPRDDFEGIAAAGDSVVLMTSAGKLYFFRLGAQNTVPFTMVATGLRGSCELEGLGWHRASNTLVMPCKQPRGQATTGLTIMRYHLGSTPGPVAPIVVSGGELARVTGLARIRATSVEVDSISGNLVVLSSKPPLILEIDLNGRALGMKRLPYKYHPQAEGLTLSANALWIADEGTGRKGTLARYSCR